MFGTLLEQLQANVLTPQAAIVAGVGLGVGPDR